MLDVSNGPNDNAGALGAIARQRSSLSHNRMLRFGQIFRPLLAVPAIPDDSGRLRGRRVVSEQAFGAVLQRRRMENHSLLQKSD